MAAQVLTYCWMATLTVAADKRRAGGVQRMRVLVAFEDTRSLYRDTIAWAIGDLRPGVEVRSVNLEELPEALDRLDPHVVVCSQPNDGYSKGRGAWVEVPTSEDTHDKQLAEICLDGNHWKTDGPPLREILEIIDETRERLRRGRLSEIC